MHAANYYVTCPTHVTDNLDIQSSRCYLEELKYRLRYPLNNNYSYRVLGKFYC